MHAPRLGHLSQNDSTFLLRFFSYCKVGFTEHSKWNISELLTPVTVTPCCCSKFFLATGSIHIPMKHISNSYCLDPRILRLIIYRSLRRKKKKKLDFRMLCSTCLGPLRVCKMVCAPVLLIRTFRSLYHIHRYIDNINIIKTTTSAVHLCHGFRTVVTSDNLTGQ